MMTEITTEINGVMCKQVPAPHSNTCNGCMVRVPARSGNCPDIECGPVFKEYETPDNPCLIWVAVA